ncbi:MAG TPA: ribose-5-phosphate isomerase RpiA [Chloroflexia bacterium]|nr:ribose-5-phosphate isomerase RpiA [Chloroflexia bacterium]
MTADTRALKHAAALKAIEYVREGMVLGLGTGSTAEYAVRELGDRVRQGLRITGVPTSDRTAALARELGIPLTSLEENPHLDLTIDGADEVVLSTLDVVKGLGGALLREKIVALASGTEILIVDESKVVSRLGDKTAVPVEVVAFGWGAARSALEALGCEPTRRSDKGGQPYVTDSGNYLLDCKFPGIAEPAQLARKIKQITGVVEHGIFAGIACTVVVARQDGVQVYDREA